MQWHPWRPWAVPKLTCRVQRHLWNVLPASTCLPRPSFKFEYFRRKDGRLCRHVKLQTAESPNTWHFPSCKLLFAVSYYFHTSFKLASNSSFKLAAKGELHVSWARELEICQPLIGIQLFKFSGPGKCSSPLIASLKLEFETSLKLS